MLSELTVKAHDLKHAFHYWPLEGDDVSDGRDRPSNRSELQRDASLSHAALAERVGASAASVWRRVRNLEKEKVLGRRCASPMPSARASVNVLCQVRMTRQTMDARADFEALHPVARRDRRMLRHVGRMGLSAAHRGARRRRL
jgi:DNA-binding Lrp family transcriptional regulator